MPPEYDHRMMRCKLDRSTKIGERRYRPGEVLQPGDEATADFEEFTPPPPPPPAPVRRIPIRRMTVNPDLPVRQLPKRPVPVLDPPEPPAGGGASTIVPDPI